MGTVPCPAVNFEGQKYDKSFLNMVPESSASTLKEILLNGPVSEVYNLFACIILICLRRFTLSIIYHNILIPTIGKRNKRKQTS